MVDINLLGEEREAPEEREKTFAETVSLDTRELVREPKVEARAAKEEPMRFGPSPQRRWGPIIGIGALVVVIAIGAYVLRSRVGKVSPLPFPKVKEKITTPATPKPTAPPPEPVVDPVLKEVITTTHLGVNVMEKILNAAPEAMKFTLVSYSDGRFHLESLAPSSSEIDHFRQNLSPSLSGGEVNVLSQEPKTINGQRFQKALLSGSVVPGAFPPAGIPAAQAKDGELENFVKTFCQENRLVLKQFSARQAVGKDSYQMTPIVVSAYGNRQALMQLLKEVAGQYQNVNLSKILLVARTGDAMADLILNVEVYAPA